MGTGINTQIEIFDDGKWQSLCIKIVDWIDSPLHRLEDKNYVLFSVLANVQAKSYVPLAQPQISDHRGVPEDSPLRSSFNPNPEPGEGEYASAGLGQFGYTWVTLAELLAYPWKTAEIVHHNGWRRPLPMPSVKTFVEQVIPHLQNLVNDPRQLRIIMGFDN